ncbi:MAG: hypothetical protein GXY52_01780 [Chloroflexi bacterium]|nr:hypothetical protein [Chloroflexota bacterium]
MALRKAMAGWLAIEREIPAFVELFREQWLQRARYSEIRITLHHFSRLLERYNFAHEWLAIKLARLEAGEAVALDLEEYTQRTGRYEILYQAWVRHIQELGFDLGRAPA